MNGCSRLHIRSDEVRCPAWEHRQAALPKGAEARDIITDSAAKPDIATLPHLFHVVGVSLTKRRVDTPGILTEVL